MKIACISDIHGNATALKAVLDDIRKKKIDRVLVLGDLCYRGPEPQKCIDLVRETNPFIIKGNADEWVVRGVLPLEVPDPVLNMMNYEREWIISKLDSESISYLQSLPMEIKIEIKGIEIHAYHATPHSLFEIIPPDESEVNILEKMMVEEADIYVCAHIHKPYIRYIKGKCIINTGSVGLPFDGDNRASYAIIEVGRNFYQSSIIKVNYDINNVINQFDESDYPNKDLMIRLLQNSRP